VAGEGFAQRRPAGAELGGGGVDAAELFGELKGAFGLGAVGQEAAGLPAHRSAETSSEHAGLRGEVRRAWGILGRTTGPEGAS
jgi:hypothetical protein